MDAAEAPGRDRLRDREPGSLAVRVYRYGCRVGEDRLRRRPTATTTFQSWSMAKSITALVFGRAMYQNLDRARRPAGLADPDRRPGARRDHDAPAADDDQRPAVERPSRLQHLHAGPPPRGAHGPGREGARHLLGVLAERPGAGRRGRSQRAVGEDFQAFAQRELFGPLGIEPGTWSWERDSAGHTQGFFGLHMTRRRLRPPRRADAARRRLARASGCSRRRFVREAVTPVAQSGCYGWFIWLNASKPCVSPRVVDRPVSDDRMFPTLPADLYQFAGLFGQW